jgi:hypothetical protein
MGLHSSAGRPRKMDYTGYKKTGSMRFCDAQGNEFLFNRSWATLSHRHPITRI